MGIFTLSDSYKNEIKTRADLLKDAYKTYRLLQELAPFFTQVLFMTEISKKDYTGPMSITDRRTAIKNGKAILRLNKTVWNNFFHEVKLLKKIDMNSTITFDQYRSWLGRNELMDEATVYGFDMFASDFITPDGKPMDKYSDIADMFLLKKILPAMNQHPDEKRDKLMIMMSACFALVHIIAYCLNEIEPRMLPIASVLFSLTVVKLIFDINHHAKGQAYMSKLCQENLIAVDKEIQGLKDPNSATAKLSIVQAKHPTNDSTNKKDNGINNTTVPKKQKLQ